MSAIDLAILGIVMEKPCCAYDIKKDVQQHHYDRWTKIGVPTIYQNVHRLQSAGYLQSEQLPGEKALPRAVYSITEKGREYFIQLMTHHVEQPVAFLFDFNVVITNLSKLPPQQAIKLLNKLHDNISEAAQENAATAAKYATIPKLGLTIFRQQQKLYQALLQWLNEFIAEFIEGC